MSFYAGMLKYKSTQSIYDLHKKSKEFLNTNGNGWRPPITNFLQYKYKIEPITITINDSATQPCVNLILTEDDTDSEDAEMIVSLPKIEMEPNEELTNVWLPFKRKHNFNFNSETSAFILMRYYVAVIKCYKFQGMPPIKFQHRFSKWISENILSFIYDGNFYPGLGAILRIVESLKESGQEKLLANPMIPLKTGSKETIQNSNDFTQIQQQVDKIKEHEKESVPGFFSQLFSTEKNKFNDEQRKKAIIFWSTLIAALFVFILVTIIAIILKYRKKKTKPIPVRKVTKIPSFSHLSDNEEPPVKWYNKMFSSCIRKKSDSDEEIELGPDSPSIMSKGRNNNFNVSSNNSGKSKFPMVH